MFLINLIDDRYNIKSSLHKDRNKYRICVGSKFAPIILNDLKCEFPPMDRKII